VRRGVVMASSSAQVGLPPETGIQEESSRRRRDPATNRHIMAALEGQHRRPAREDIDMRRGLWSALALGLVLAPLTAPAQTRTSEQAALREIYRELIEINTTDSVGDNTKAAEAMAARLCAASFPAADVQVLAPAPRKGNLIVRYRGTGVRKPLLLLA